MITSKAKRDTARKQLLTKSQLRKVQDSELPEPELVAMCPPPDYQYLIGKEPRTTDKDGNELDLSGLRLESCWCGLLRPTVPCESCRAWIGEDVPKRMVRQQHGLLIVGALVLLVVVIMAGSVEDSPGRGRGFSQIVELD